MRYTNGELVHVGDLVKFDPNITGRVVCAVDTNEYTDKYPEAQWASYLEKGILVETNEIGLVHLEENDINLNKIA